MTPERLLDAMAIAKRMGVSSETVRAWIRAGKLKAITTPTGRYRIPSSALARLLATRRKMQESQTPSTINP